MTRGRRPGQAVGPYAGAKHHRGIEATPQLLQRLDARMTQHQLADKAGVSLKTVRAWEEGQRVQQRSSHLLSTALGLPLWRDA